MTTLHIVNSGNIIIGLLPESVPNTVNSSIRIASKGYLDHHATERIMPGNWVDASYTAFGKKKCRYLVSNELGLNPDVVPLDSHPGAVCVGGYGEAGLAGCEFLFPLRDCPDHRGIYPVFDRVLKGMDKLCKLEKVETTPVTDFPIEGVEVNCPVKPETIERIELEPHGKIYPEPVRVWELELSEYWK